MGSNRKRPFGYRMELGESVLHPAEAETVRWIYDSYLAGASYNALVDKLQERGIPYDGDKPWNKNRAASADAEAASACGKSSPVRNSATRRRRNKSLISSFPRACTSGMTVSPPIAWLAGS